MRLYFNILHIFLFPNLLLVWESLHHYERWFSVSCTYQEQLYVNCHFRAAIYANRHYLALYQNWHKERLAKNGELKPQIIGDVYIHPTADVHPTAVVCIWLVYASVCMHADVCKIANTLFKNYLCCTVVKISKTWL